MRKRKFFVALIFLNFIYSLNAQDIKFTASAPKVVQNGETFRIIFKLNAKGANFKAPSFSPLTVQGPSVSSQSSIEIINGRMKQNYSYSYVFFAQAYKSGNFTISPAEITVNGKKYYSNKLNIEVVGDNKSAQAAANNPVNEKAPLFVKTFVDKKSVFLGESLMATIKFYTRVDIADINDVKMPHFTSFWTQDIFNATQIQFERENVGGQIYNVAVIKKVLLFPQKIGTLTISPFQMEVVKGRRTFFGVQAAGKQVLKSKPVKIKVKDFPLKNPANFIGAVGQFTMSAKLSDTIVKTNDAVNLVIRFKGKGNLKLIEAPKVNFPSDFEVFDPKESTNVKNTEQGQIGSRAFKYLIIPRHSGNFTIPGQSFSYFNPTKKSFVNMSTGDMHIRVEKGEGDQNTAVINNQTIVKSKVEQLNSDILYIKQNIPVFQQKDNYFIGTFSYYLCLFIPSFILLVLIILLRKRAKEMSDLAKLKNKRASKISRQRLKLAQKEMKKGNKTEFYDAIHAALLGYLSDKLNIPPADLSTDKLKQELLNKNIDEKIVTDYLELLSKNEFARYAPGQLNDNLKEVYIEAANLIELVDKQL